MSPTGTVTFFSNGTQVGTGTVSAGVATLNIASLAEGTNSLTASYAGDPNFVASTSLALAFVGSKPALVITWATPAASSYGTALSATQLNATANVPGTFAYSPAAGVVLSAGTHTLNVTFTPTDTTNYATATASVSIVVNKAVLTVTANNASRTYGTANPVFTSTITGFVNGDTQASAVTGAPGLTTTATTASPAGPYPITVALGTLAAANYTFTLVNGILTVSKGTSSLTVVSSQNPSTFAASVMFSVTLSASATGTVNFMDGTTVLGTGTVSGGTASFSTTTLSAGTHSITAVYSGDANYNGVTSAVTSQVINKATPGVGGTPPVTASSSSPNPAPPGSPITISVALPPGATGTVSFYDATTLLGTSPASSGAASFTIPPSTLSAGTPLHHRLRSTAATATTHRRPQLPSPSWLSRPRTSPLPRRPGRS